MNLPFFESGPRKKPDQVLSVDLGTRITKAVCLARRDRGFALCGYTMVDAPIFENTISADLLCEHLKTLCQAFPTKPKSLVLTVGVNDAIVRPVEIPSMPMEDLRSVLRLNARTYLQQDLAGYAFDCLELPGPLKAEPPDAAAKPGAPPRQKVLVAAAKQQVVDDGLAGARNAGLSLEALIPGLIGPANAFELAMPDLFKKEVTALVDVGFRNSSICLFQEGELVLNRVVNVGGDRLTSALSEAMSITYAEAEGLKVGMAHEVEFALEPVLIPLGRELRASLDFFEHQRDRQVTQVFISGGSTRSEFLMRTLQNELGVECRIWDATSFLQKELPPGQTADFERAGPQLAVAVGAALAAL
jgi:type IV pilus assembly protein PilM